MKTILLVEESNPSLPCDFSLDGYTNHYTNKDTLIPQLLVWGMQRTQWLWNSWPTSAGASLDVYGEDYWEIKWRTARKDGCNHALYSIISLQFNWVKWHLWSPDTSWDATILKSGLLGLEYCIGNTYILSILLCFKDLFFHSWRFQHLMVCLVNKFTNLIKIKTAVSCKYSDKQELCFDDNIRPCCKKTSACTIFLWCTCKVMEKSIGKSR